MLQCHFPAHLPWRPQPIQGAGLKGREVSRLLEICASLANIFNHIQTYTVITYAINSYKSTTIKAACYNGAQMSLLDIFELEPKFSVTEEPDPNEHASLQDLKNESKLRGT